MCKILSIVVLFTVIFCSCGNHDNKQEKTVTDTMRVVSSRHISDTMIVGSKCILYCWLDSVSLARMQKQMGEDDFSTVADDAAYYMAEASRYLDSAGKQNNIKTFSINADSIKVIQFVNKDGIKDFVRLDTGGSIANIYFFDPLKGKKVMDVFSAQEEYDSFFKR